MRHLITILIGGVLTCIAGPPELAPQQAQTEAELALESLLMMPVSTASKYDQKQTEAPSFVTIITREEIRTFGYRTLEEVLWNQTGFYSGTDRQYSDVGFRGVGRPGYYNNKLLVLLDGHTINDAYSAGARVGGAGAVDLETIQRIELVRGPGSALYGARAMLAVVNLVTRKGLDMDGLEFSGDLGSFRNYGGSVRYGTVLGPEADLFVSGSWASSEGEDIYFPELDNPILNDGVAEGLDWERRGRALLTFRYGDFTFQAGGSDREKGIPTAVYKSTFNHPDTESRDRNLFLEAAYTKDFGSGSELALRAFGDTYDNEGFYPHTATTSGEDPGSIPPSESYLRSRSFGGEVRFRWDPTSSQRFVVGLEGNRTFRAANEFLPVPELDTNGDHPYWILSAFVQHESQLTDKLALTLGLRRDEYSIRGSATTPRGALVFHASESTTLKLLAGKAFRAPNTLELFMFQPDAAWLGNPNLDPERIRSIEGIWQQRFGALATTVSLYHNEIEGLIDFVEVPSPDSLRSYGTLMFQQQNTDNVKARGLELEARWVLPAGVSTRVGYGWARATDSESGSKALNSPEHQLRLGASKNWEEWGSLGLNARAETGRRTLFGQDTDPMAIVDLSATSTALFDRVTLQLLAKNLLDASYPLPGGFQHVQSVIPQPGRSLLLRAEVRW